MESLEDIIVAPATLTGGALSVIRVSGKGAIELMSDLFRSPKKDTRPLTESRGYTLHYGDIIDENGATVDDVMLSLFRAPHSFTGEDGVEISCHGSSYIVQRIIELTIHKGARMATAGEFTTRAFMAGKIDLSQAEAICDTIASTTRATHQMARTQMRGGYSEMLEVMRQRLLHISAMLELELDFSEEEVEFASREELRQLMNELRHEIERLRESFQLGNAIKNGVAVAIVGAPNAGKSTLLNQILGEDRAMVSEIAGTTRDSIEESFTIDGITFRFIDTAGLHTTQDKLEQMGIERTHAAISRAKVVIQLIDIAEISSYTPIVVNTDQTLITIFNKIDVLNAPAQISRYRQTHPDALFISAKDGQNIEGLRNSLSRTIDTKSLYEGDVIVSNARHYAHLTSAYSALISAQHAQQSNLPSDLIVEDLRHTLHEIGSITGSITTDEILRHIFSSFCIGK